MATRIARGFGQYGGVARAIERVGERWTLLIVRDLLAGARRYSDLKAGLPRIPTNILSDRLKELQEAGVVRRVPTVRGGYELTALGRALEPVVVELERWGWALLGDLGDGEILTADALALTLRAAFQPARALELPPTEYVLHTGDISVSAIVDGASLDVAAVGVGALPAPNRQLSATGSMSLLELTLEPAGLRDLLGGGQGPSGSDAELMTRFQRTFRIVPDRTGKPAEQDAAVA
ncbi:MAG: helix-turn-helix domain-containing protein [Nakamurella sp.]